MWFKTRTLFNTATQEITATSLIMAMDGMNDDAAMRVCVPPLDDLDERFLDDDKGG
jgi:hypothetical protein